MGAYVMRRFLNLATRFGRDERGVFAIMFALMAIVLIALAGAVVDYVSLVQTRNRAQIALDAATLALQPRIYETTTAEIEKLAEALMLDRIGSDSVDAEIDRVVVDTELGSLHLEAIMRTPTIFVSLVGVKQLSARIVSEAMQGAVSVEVSVAVDLSGSMNNSIPDGNGGTTTRIASLRAALNELIDLIVLDDQTPNYSKMALVPYSMAVNVGPTYAPIVRGSTTQPTAITNITWASGAAQLIAGATTENPVVITSANHGFANGDYVYINNAGGMAEINNTIFEVRGRTANTYELKSTNGKKYATYTSGGTATKCLVSTCELVVTSNNHGIRTGEYAYISDVNGMNSFVDNGYIRFDNNSIHDDTKFNWINNNTKNDDYRFLVWKIGATTTNTFVLPGTAKPSGKSYGTYTSGGTVACVVEGCSQLLFTNPYAHEANGVNTSKRRNPISSCVTERDVNTFTDASYLTTLVGRNYPATSNNCLLSPIIPLTSSKATLHSVANALTAVGSTGGQIGVAWAWYLLSPTFNGPWPSASQPSAYKTTRPVAKAVVLMTDGEYNTIYRRGVIAQNSTSGSGDTRSMISENAGNGSPYVQTETLCKAMKDAGITVYTVGLAIDDKPIAKQMMVNCASDPSKAYTAGNGAALGDVFADIATNLSNLRITN